MSNVVRPLRDRDNHLVPFAARHLLVGSNLDRPAARRICRARRLVLRERLLGAVSDGPRACIVELLDEIAAQVVQDAHRREEAIRVDEVERAEGVVRLAELRERLLDGGVCLFRTLRRGKCAAHRRLDFDCAALRCRGNLLRRNRDTDIELLRAGIVARTIRWRREHALDGVGHGAVDALAGLDGEVFGDFDLDVRSGGDLEDGSAGDGLSHLAYSEPEVASVGHRVELESVVHLQRARRVEPEPAAPFAVARHALDGSDGRAEVSERVGVDRRGRVASVEVEKVEG